jgi:hypothetical protein
VTSGTAVSDSSFAVPAQVLDHSSTRLRAFSRPWQLLRCAGGLADAQTVVRRKVLLK